MLLLLALLIPAGAMAQDNEQAIQKSRPAKVKRMTYEQMTEKMVGELQAGRETGEDGNEG